MGEQKFWGTIKSGGKTFAIVGDADDTIEKAKAALGTIAAVTANAPSAPLPVAPLMRADSAPKDDVPKDGPQKADDTPAGVGRAQMDAVRGAGRGSKWGAVRAPEMKGT